MGAWCQTEHFYTLSEEKTVNEEQTNEASRFLLALARRNARLYAGHSATRAIIVTGSSAEGVSDFYSDLDMIIYYDTLPSQEELLASYRRNQGQERMLLGEPSEEGTLETYQVHGVECQFVHTTVANWERDMATVLEQLDVTSPLQKAFGGLLEAVPLYGEPLIRDWQAKLKAYPDTLAEAMVNHYLTFFPLWGLQERLAVRDATIWVHEMLVDIAQHLLGTLAGLNRCYYSPFQFKRLHRFAAQLELAPARFADRLDAIFSMDMVSAAGQAEELVRETVTLVEQHMPQIDTSRVRRRLDWRESSWQPLPENET